MSPMAPARAHRTIALRVVGHPAVRLAILALVVLLVAHDLVYAAGHGVGRVADALSASGHDPYWRLVGLAGIVGLAALVTTAARRWQGLRARLGGLIGAVPGSDIRRVVVRRPTVGEVVRVWLWLLAIALPLFVVQENVEHYLGHAGHLPLLGVLVEPQHLAALPVFGLVALLVAVVAAGVEVRLAGLERAVRIAERWSLRRPAAILPGSASPPTRLLRRTNSLATPDLGRAPPLASMI